MASPSPSWVILGAVPLVSAAAELQAGADLSLALAAPPRVAQLTVAPRVSPADPDPQAALAFPCVIATEPSGLLLAVTPPSASERPPTRPRLYRGPDGVERTIHIGLVPRPVYFVLDVPSATASRVPHSGIFDMTSIGVIADPGGDGGYMVAEFQLIVSSVEAILLCFSPETGEWVQKVVNNPLPCWNWTFNGVISHDGKLWWVDRAKGLLACDPFADQPDMAYVPLPEGGVHDEHHHGCYFCSKGRFRSRRCVQVSDGKFRCVEMSCTRQGGAPMLTMRTLADPETAEWTLEYQVSFAEIWAGDSYKAAGLPEKSPVVALIHPKNPDVVYFFVNENIISVDMRAKKVVECEAHELAGLSSTSAVSSYCVLTWELPPTLTAGLPGEVSGVKEESQVATI